MRLGHLVTVFAVGAEGPCQSGDAGNGEAHDGRVGLPVCGLRIPTTGWRPDVLGVPARGAGQKGVRRAIGGVFLRDLSSSAHGEVWLCGYNWVSLELAAMRLSASEVHGC